MIVGYYFDWEIDVFLNSKQLSNLVGGETLEGVVIQADSLLQTPEKICKLSINKTKAWRGANIESNSREKCWRVYIDDEVANDLKETGKTRKIYNSLGYKINFYDISRKELNSDIKRVYELLLKAV